jgi:glycosyltransferase involved in cell wall biosynthesis
MNARFRKTLINIGSLLRHPLSVGRRRALRTARPDSAARAIYEASARRAVSADALERIVLVSHDAQPHGAQLLALNLARALSVKGFGVDAVMLGDGPLLAHFADVATLHRFSPAIQSRKDILGALKNLRRGGARISIVNTTVSGELVPLLNEAGFSTVALVHELPGMLRRYGLKRHAHAIASDSDFVVFSAALVQQGFVEFAGQKPTRAVIRPQGLYARSASGERAETRAEVRRELGLKPDAKIIANVGYADRRKGLDLFVAAASTVLRDSTDAVALWVGGADSKILASETRAIREAGLADRFVFTGNVSDPQRFYQAADVLAFTSREDPFPSVVLEALDAGLAIVGFRGAGGFSDLLDRGCGVLVPKFDTVAMAREIISLLGNPEHAEALGRRGAEIVEAEFSFDAYVDDLLAMGRSAAPRVSVIVPNYNYARYLKARLDSISAQSFVPFELIVLDDASTDDSAAIIDQELAGMPFPTRFIRNDVNSGSVFRQWRKGIEMAEGDLVWIAEADDLADPDFLRETVRPFASSDVVMSYTQSRQIDEDGGQIAADYLRYVADIDRRKWTRDYVVPGRTEIADALFIKNTIPNVSAVVFRRTALMAVLTAHGEEIMSYRHAGDWVTYLRLLERGSIAFKRWPLNAHRRHAASVTVGNFNLGQLDEIIRVQRDAVARYGLGADAARRADAYAQKLYKQFGLVSAEHPVPQQHPDLRHNYVQD